MHKRGAGIVTYTLRRFRQTRRKYKHKRPTPVAWIPDFQETPPGREPTVTTRFGACLRSLLSYENLPDFLGSKVTIRLSTDRLRQIYYLLLNSQQKTNLFLELN